ncbi:hypothetical protein [Streptomyces sp. NPDC051218]|uniref:hypothetical protein n=1 Tax=Streptomyces sp. NPDC051218 TaxID=3365645 RepID=UPI00378F3513
MTIDLAVLLAVVIIVLLRRRVAPRTKFDTGMTMAVVLVFGVLIAPTAFGQWILDAVRELAQGISDTGSP